ncbi:MAG: DUF5615 family PIN-like protein [Ilumatobacteraceae bacterium]
MRFLLDENQSPAIVGLLVEAGHDVVHVRDLDMRGSPDVAVLAAASAADRVVISADTDFGELLAVSNARGPSILLLRRQQQRRALEIAALILANLDDVAEDLRAGAIVVIDDDRVRIRRLPLRPD